MADLTSKERDALPAEHFAVPGKRQLPIHDATHVRLAWDMVGRTKGLTPAERSEARTRIRRRAKELGVNTDDWKVHASFDVHGIGLSVPAVANHPNRMPFSGILTRIGVPSDEAPHGTDGKRIILTHDAVENALSSLLGMAVDLAPEMKSHDVQNKIGVITGAHIDGDALMCEGFIYAADFPKEALRIHLDQADLGFSFEALNLSVESLDDDPLVVKSLCFTGAAILMKNSAAYTTTRLAAAAAREHEMNDDLLKAIKDAVGAAIAPISETVTQLKAGQETSAAALAAMAAKVEAGPVQAHAATIAAVEPHAKALDACAAGCEAAGLGLDPTRGHVTVMRKMAGHMRAEAAQGKMPAEYPGANGGYWAGADRPQNDDNNPTIIALRKEVAEIKANADKIAKAAADAQAAADTKIKDLQAAATAAKPGPERKTLSPQVLGVLAKAGINDITNDTKINASQIDAALVGIDMSERLRIKTALMRAGLTEAA